MGFTQESLAQAVGVEFSTVGRRERGALTPHAWRRSRIARVLKVNLEQLDVLLGHELSDASRAEPSLPPCPEPGFRGRLVVSRKTWTVESCSKPRSVPVPVP
ncbi:hypothetical protein GCM10022243_34000 [Saccharothrix violaceirubra]|uniref:helix-turn-helix transcriptional regulator n=1 Tax=Saccharothrix violaceirubra TaxID=413306 RepID=UPI0028AF5C16|nr:helix-turn-helix transcriptional regulator [Saccharothrix violaceirubra]